MGNMERRYVGSNLKLKLLLPTGFIAGALTGGLNFQVEHHLFPRMSSAWYPYIAPTVRRICKKHGVKYAYYPWVHQNLISTVKYVHQAGTASNWANGNPYSGTQ